MISIVSGVLLSLIFPKFNLFWLAWVALVPFFYAVYKATDARRAAFYGYALGIPFYAITFAFVLALNEWVGGLIYLAWILLVLFLSLYTALFAYLLKILSGKSFRFFLAPLLWVFIEWLRSLGPFGMVPSLGYSQWRWIALTQVASLTGVIGISILIVFGNAVLTEVLLFPDPKKKKALFVFLVVMAAIVGYGHCQLVSNKLAFGKELSLALIQGNYPQKEKLNYANLSAIKETYLELTKESLKDNPRLVLWPETSIPFYIQDDPSYLEKLHLLAKENKVNLALGLPRYDKNLRAYNSAMFISSGGEFLGWQDKHQLVPFGEYLPFRSILIPFFKRFKALKYTLLLEQDFTSGDMFESIETPVGSIGLGICSDSFFPLVFRAFDKKGTDYLFLITNDAWFKTSSAPYKHLMVDTLRAVEFRRFFVQCANTGISAVIDPWGRILEETELDQRRIVRAKIYAVSECSFYSRFGEWFAYLCMIILAAYILFKKRRPIITAA